MEISNYVGCIIVEYNNGLNNQQGTFFLINDTTIVTASHVVDNKESIKTIQLTFNGGFCSSFSYKKEFAIKSVDEISVIEFFVPIQYVPLGRRPEYNVYFSVNGFQSLSWESVGFCKNGVNPKQLHICGDKCDKIESTNGKDTFILSGIQIPWTSYEGMSGSPVLVNGLIVGILDAQDVIDGVGKNLRFTSIKKIEDRLPPEAISRVIYNNKKFAKQNYAEDFAFDNYVHRTVSYYNEAGERQFTTLLDSVLYGNQNNIVLLGDAGIGKTYELQWLAAELSKDKYLFYPVYAGLKNMASTDKIEDLSDNLRDYLNNNVPVCIILDGYDEVTDEHLRDDDFWKILFRFITQYKDNSIKVIVSSRTNFYLHNLFAGFLEVKLCQLSDNDIHKTTEYYGVNSSDFIRAVSQTNLLSFVHNPFYLKHIIGLYKDSSELPDSNRLMNSIIDHLFKDLNYGKYAGTKRLSKENTMARNNLRKIAAAVLMQGKDFSEDEYYQFIDGEINDDKETLIKLSDVFVRDIDGKCHFTHNNFKEFLAAEFFNEKYSNDLDGLLKVIAYSDQNGIRKKYLNMVSFLLSIRTHDDLLNWIAERCPENYYLFEKDKLSQDKRNMVFFRLFEDSVHKAYYLGYDYQGEIGSLVDNDEAVSYLLDQIRQSDDEMVLFNALRTLQKAHNIPTECLNEIKDTIIWFLDNEKGTDNHARDAIEVINELRLFTQKVTTFFFEKYHKSDNLEIRRGLYRYIYRNDISDLFAPFLVKGLGLKSRFEMLSLTLYYDICKFKCKQSFIVFFEFVIRLSDEYSIKSYYDHVISNDEFVENLINSYLAYKDEDYLNLIIETSCCFAENGHLRFNAFNSFFSKTNTENKAIDCYFIKFKEMPVVFYFLAGQFANYVDFLRKGYVSGKFSDCRLLFDYCVREFDKDSDERKSFTSLISDTKYSDADESLQYITIRDNVNRNINTKKLLFIKYIFDYNTFKKELIKIMRKHSFTDCKLWDLWRVLHSEYFYDAPELVFAEILKENMSFDSLISDFFGLIDSNNDYLDCFIISGLLQFIKEYDDYEKYINEEQFSLASSICREQLEKYIPDEHINYENGCSFDSWFIQPFCSLISKLDIQQNQETLLKLLYVPKVMFEDNSEIGFPEYLVKNIPEEKIIMRINSYIENGKAKGALAEECLRYCLDKRIISDSIINSAINSITNESSNAWNFYAWDYLIKIDRADILVDLIITKKINILLFINKIYSLINYDNGRLIHFIAELFDSLYVYYCDDREQELKEKYPFVDEIYSNGTLQSKLTECLKRLFEYLIRHNSHKHVELYLHDMIETKTFSPFEKDHFETYVSYISDIRFIDKLIELLKMSCVRDFDMGDFSNLISNIEKSIMNIAVGNEDLVIDKVSELKDADNACLRRTVNKIIDQLVENKNEENKETYSIKELQEFAFWDA